jgi:hypothetical protein
VTFGSPDGMLTAEDACADIGVARTPAVSAGRMGNRAAIEALQLRKKQAKEGAARKPAAKPQRKST